MWVSGYWRDPRVLPISNLVAVQDDGIARAIRFDRRAVAVLVGCYVAPVVILIAR